MNILLKERKALFFLSVFHTVVIMFSNYLVQFPILIDLHFYKFHTTPGAFTFPFIFIATDLTVRVFAAPLARKIITVVMIPALIISYIVSVIFMDGKYVGLAQLNTFSFEIFRIALASFCAYCVGQLSDIFIFNKLRQKAKWWVAPTASTVVGSAIDTYLFFLVAFFRSSDAFMAENWLKLGIADYATKLIINFILFLPLYGILLNWILKRIKSNNNL